MKSKEEILDQKLKQMSSGGVNYTFAKEGFLYLLMLEAMDEYAEEYGEFCKAPFKELRTLEDMWRKETYPDDSEYYIIPDTTLFVKWIVKKVKNI